MQRKRDAEGRSGSRWSCSVDEYDSRLVGYVVADVPHEDGNIYREPQGTIFFVGVMLRNHANVGYAVTCRHVIEGIAARCYANPAIRLNKRTRDGIYDHPVRHYDWTLSPDSDLAVLRIDYIPEADLWFHPIDDVQHGRVIAGHDIFFAGLFAPIPGDDAVEAVVRSGKIARSSKATVNLTVNDVTDQTVSADVFIVEAAAWGGESGSPVFIYEQGYELVGPPTSTLAQSTQRLSSVPG